MGASTMKLGLIAPPGYPKELGKRLEQELPEWLSYYVADEYNWEVEYVINALTGVTEDSIEVLNATMDKKDEENWDFSVCITDLPLFNNERLIVAEGNEEGHVALISLPSLGSTPMVKRVRESILQLVNEMYYGSSEEEREEAEERILSKDKEDHHELRNKNSTSLVGKRAFERLSPIRRETPDEEDSNVDVRFLVNSRGSGALRLISGMVRANRPWAMFPAFMKVIVIAFTTGAYALVFPTLWQLANNYDVWRMFMLSIVSILAMVGWVVVAHNLWEKPNQERADNIRKFYNTATLPPLA